MKNHEFSRVTNPIDVGVKVKIQASLRATAKQSSTIENHAKHFSAVAYINTLLATELKLLAMIMLYWIASPALAMTDFLCLYANSLNNIWIN